MFSLLNINHYTRYGLLWMIEIPIYTNVTKKLRDFKIAADIQEWSIIQIHVDMYVILAFLKTISQNGKKAVMHITHITYWRK